MNLKQEQDQEPTGSSRVPVEPPETDARPLAPAEKCRLATLMLKLGDDGDEWPQFLHEQQERLSRQIKVDDSHALHRRKADSAQKAQLAAAAYLQGEGSLSQMCAAYQVT